MTFLIAVPTGVKFFNWIGTMWAARSLTSRRRCCGRSASSTTFLFGGLTGIILASAAAGLPRLRLLLRGRALPLRGVRHRACSPMFAGFYFWWPKMTGQDARRDGSARSTSGLLFIGFHTTFLVQHWLGVEGMPRRYADYLAERRVHHAEPGLSAMGRSCSGASTLVVLLQRLEEPEQPEGHHRRPMGLGSLAGVGNHLPTTPRTTSLSCPRSRPSRRPLTYTTPGLRFWSTAPGG